MPAQTELAYTQILPGDGTKRIGFVSTDCRIPLGFDPAITEFMSRSYHIATDDISQIELVYANWYGAEQNSGSLGTFTASVEYPSGTFTRVTFSGLNSGTALFGTNLFSDLVELSSKIPCGDAFWVRTYYTSAGGSQWAVGSTTLDGANFGSSGIADLTLTPGSFGPGGAVVRPIAILGYTSKPSIALYGDSRVAGTADHTGSQGDLTSTQGYERFASKYGGYSNQAVPGETASGFISTHGLRVSISKFATHVICNYGINDIIINLSTLSAIQASIQTISSYFNPSPVYWCTEEPWTTSTDGWTTVSNQTPTANDSVRIALNDSLRSFGNGVGFLGLSGYVEVADSVESSRDSGFWVPDVTTDGIHMTVAASDRVRSASVPIYGDIAVSRVPPDVTFPVSGTLLTTNGNGSSLTGLTKSQVGISSDQFIATLSTDFSFTTATLTKLPLNTTAFNTNSKFDTSDHKWVPSSGIVMLGLNIGISEVAGSDVKALIYKNSSPLARITAVPSVNYYVPLMVSVLDQANGTDYYEAYVYSSGSTLSVDHNLTYFFGTTIQ